ncbi:MAG: tripartite tricarboxylate transporter substrate binding protein [Burkholderiaceae bacterium]
MPTTPGPTVPSPPECPARRSTLQRLFAAAASTAVPGLAATDARAQAAPAAGPWPNRAIRIVQPWAAGGGGDIVTRVIADKMRAELGVPVVVENRPGAGGNVGAEFVARQPPDGYTLMTTAAGFSISPSLYRNLGYDTLKDFIPVTKIATAPLLVLVRADSPLKTMADLVALAKKDPKGVTYGSFGNGSPSHLIGERINRLMGISMTHVPYTGGGAATDLQGGSLTLAILDAVSQTPQVKAGKVRALALNGTNRLPALPDVPTLVECGIPFELVGWHAMFAPAGTPREIVERLNRVVNQVIAMPDVRTRIFEAGSFPVQPPTSVEQWGSMFRQDVQNWAELVRASGATIN